jgi:putative MATE family efflux protein
MILLLAVPAWFQQMLHTTVRFSDRVIVGRFLSLETDNVRFQAASVAAQLPAGDLPHLLSLLQAVNEMQRQAHRSVEYQAAQTTASYIDWFITSCSVLISAGATALVARFVGAGDRQGAVRVTHQALLLAVLLGTVGAVAGVFGAGPAMRLLNLQGEAAQYAAEYLQPLMCVLPLQIIVIVGIACLAGAGDTMAGMRVLIGVVILNIPLAWGFSQGWGPFPRLGFQGIAVGTALSECLAAGAVLMMLWRGRAGLQLDRRLFRPDTDLLRRLLRISVPAGVDSISLILCQLWFLSIVNNLGTTAGAAHGIALQWEALGYQAGAAFATAAMTLTGQYLGAGRPDQAARSVWTTFCIGGGIMSCFGLLFFFQAESLFLLFCPHPDQRGTVAAGVPVLRLIAFAMPAVAAWLIFLASLRGAGDTRVPVLITWAGMLGLRIPLAYLFTGPLGWGLLGAWWAMVTDLHLRAACYIARFLQGKWQRIQV